jgi:hypothetical protein
MPHFLCHWQWSLPEGEDSPRTAAMLMAPDEARVAGQERGLSCPRASRIANPRREEGTNGKRVVRRVRLDGVGPAC